MDIPQDQKAQDVSVDTDLSAHLALGLLQAKRGELIDSELAWLEIEEMKDIWRSSGR